MQQRAELEIAHPASVQSDSRADLESKLDDVAAVLACVRVVGLDHVAQDQSGPAVGGIELAELGEPRAAFPGEEAEDAEERDHGQDGPGSLDRDDGGEEGDGRQSSVDAVDPHLLELTAPS